MFQIYISSVIIWMVIIYCVAEIAESSIRAHGWYDNNKPIGKHKTIKVLSSLFALSAVPILRAFVVLMMLCMASHTKQELKDFLETLKDDE